VRRLERSCEEHDAPRVVRDSFQRTWRSHRRCDPYQEDRINIFEARIKRLGNREIPAHHLDLWRQAGRIRVASHRAEPRSRGPQLIDNLATHVPGAADDEDTVHNWPILQGGMGVDHSSGTTASRCRRGSRFCYTLLVRQIHARLILRRRSFFHFRTTQELKPVRTITIADGSGTVCTSTVNGSKRPETSSPSTLNMTP
jgi:hypothetical protein